MGLSWQQGPISGRDPDGRFLTAGAVPERPLFAEPLRRRMSVAHGPDRNLSVDEVGGIRVVGNESRARVRG